MNASHPPAGRGGILVALLLLPVACAHAPPQAPTPVHSRGPRAPELSDAVTQIMEAHHLPAVGLVVVSATATQALLVLGHRVAGEGAAAELNDAWQLGSVTKTFTALVLDQLLADRPGGWDTTVAEVLGQGALSGAIAPASLRALAEHRAGVLRDPDPAWVASDAELSMSERRRRLALHILEAPRGAEVLSYSNAGYHVLGAVAEALGRDSWEHLVSTRLGLPTARYGETGEPAPHVFRDGRCVPVERLKEDLVYDTFAPAGHVTLDLAALADYLRRNLSSARGDGPFDQQLYAGEPRTRVWFAEPPRAGSAEDWSTWEVTCATWPPSNYGPRRT